MLDKELGKDIALEEREGFLRDNCDEVSDVTYAKAFSPEELAQKREELTDASIKIADIEDELKLIKDSYKEKMKPMMEQKVAAIKALRDKSQTVTEQCFKFYDEETGMVGYYNKEGNLVNSRPAFANEKQKTVFSLLRTGTDN